MTGKEVLQAQQDYLFPSMLHYFEEPLVIARAKDQFVYDVDGNEYLDFFGGIVVISLGHCNEEVNRRIHEQVDTLQHCSTLFATQPQAALAKRIAGITPGGGTLSRSFFTTSGTEANEMAVLTARCATGNTEVVALRYSYHGRSAMGLAMTGQAFWRLGPAMSPGFVHAQNAYCYRCPYGLEYPSCEIRCAKDVEETIQTQTCGRIAGFIAEPVQGTSGFITPPPEYFSRVAEIVRRYGGLFLSDEVQSGWGRTGKWFGIEHYGVQPDIIASAKGMGNGTPIGVTITSTEISSKIPGPTISTFGGNPVAATAAHAVIDIIDTRQLMQNALDMGAVLREGLVALQVKYSCIGDVRGMGLMQAIELVTDRTTKEPATQLTLRLMEETRRNGILVGKAGMWGNVLRLSPPLTVGRLDIHEFLKRLDKSLSAAISANG